MSLTILQTKLGAFAASFILSCFIYVSVMEATILPRENVRLLSTTAYENLKDLNSLTSPFRGPMEEWSETKFQRNLVMESISSTMKSFINEFNKKRNSPAEFGMFLDDMFEGVHSDHCKGHILEWILRFGGEDDTNLFSEEDKWVLQSKLKQNIYER